MTPERLRALEMLDFPSPSHARAAVAELAAEVRKGWETVARRMAERDAALAALRDSVHSLVAERDAARDILVGLANAWRNVAAESQRAGLPAYELAYVEIKGLASEAQTLLGETP